MELIRKLSDVEASFAYMHALLKGNTQVTTWMSIDAPLGAAELGDAVRRWARRLPLLRARIEERDGSLWFAPGPGPGPEQLRHGPVPAGHSPEDLLAEELNDVLPTGGALWRLRAATDEQAGVTHLYFTRNHAISDGHSTGGTLRVLLEELFGAPRNAAPEPFSRNGDELTYTAPAPGAEGLRPLPDAPGPVPGIPFAVRAPWEERGTAFVPADLSSAGSEAVKLYCRRRGLTVNQFFATALAESFALATGRDEVEFFTAVSLRRRYAEEESLADLGCFISVARAPLRLGGGSFKEHAEAYRDGFRAADAAWRPQARPHHEIRAAVAAAAAAGSAPGICITNVGPVDASLGAHAGRVTGFRTVVNRTGANYGLVLHLSTFRGAFGLALSYGTPSVDPSVAEGTAKLLRERLALAAGAASGEDPRPRRPYGSVTIPATQGLRPVPAAAGRGRAARGTAPRTRPGAAG
ncbi:hypothetical protein Q3V23_19385 [Streptomyces sp. VNUA116]|uniref:hypothetical protein n=1 Tax=Streptomyces sp. VNUA116 TaxID=3062449 RepID=UPI00267495CB|nr:hypothetical protein [Streptomyces sp. VNUA116]WKU46050.1 hypothetical protein Q3V23_19385 [Streptomyces sp. VNUA116]